MAGPDGAAPAVAPLSPGGLLSASAADDWAPAPAGSEQYDLTATLSRFLDRHLVLPLVEFLFECQGRPPPPPPPGVWAPPPPPPSQPAPARPVV
jgi:hypothetical protein